MDNVGYVTQTECSERRKDIYYRIEEHEKDITELKITDAKISTSLESMLTIGKAIFAVVASGIVSIIVILLTRGL